jgi:heptosyltransferase-2
LTGSSSDEWVSKAFQNSGAIDLIGKTSVMDLVALYGQCRLLISHDSGPLHLAALTGTPVLALFGPTNPFEKVSGAENQVLWGGETLACRPCYDGRNYADCQDNQCLKSIDIEKVFLAALKMV